LPRKVSLTRQLNTFDATNLVIGSTIGADIYVAAALCARLLGSASLVIWLIGGVMAIVIALSFAYCAAILPKAGGPYAYAKTAAGPLSGFMVGWALLLAEWFSLAVFPVAFTQYFMAFVPGLDPFSQILLKAAFMLIIFMTNMVGVKAAGKFNDILTIAKVSPLLLLVGLGVIYIIAQPQMTLSHFQPFFGGDPNNIGQVLVIVFWAYAGFELSTLPADEIQNPKKTIPRAITVGMLIVAAFYIVTNFVVLGVVDRASLAASQAPLTVAAANVLSLSPILAWIGSLVVGLGALISIMGADESGTIGTSRLAFAMSVDGLLPHVFSRLHKTYRTPYVALAVLCSTAFVASILGTLSVLVNSSVFLLSFAYLATGISTYILERKHRRLTEKQAGRLLIPVFTVIFSFALMTQVTEQQILVSLVLLALGVPVYTFFSPKKELEELKAAFLSRESILERTYHQEEVFLAYVMRRIKLLIYRHRGIEKAWSIEEEPPSIQETRS
jgi:APA family basic amino acid/polyamine antiporter